MRRYFLLFLFVAAFITLSFLIVEAFEVPFLHDPSFILEKGGLIAAAMGVLLLAIDIVLPVPSSIVMIANGAMFGVVTGAMLSMTGSLISALLGYEIGRKGKKYFGKYLKAEDQEYAESLIKNWGVLAVIVTRPIPVLSETVVIIAGASGIKRRTFLWGSVAGLLPAVFIYAVSGAYVLEGDFGVLSFIIVLLAAFIFIFLSTTWRNWNKE